MTTMARRHFAMLSTLRIKNLALVSDLTLQLQPGYNAITGETGAGKSIIIGALHLALGERADRELIRAGSENCSVEAVFEGEEEAVAALVEFSRRGPPHAKVENVTVTYEDYTGEFFDFETR